MSQILQYPNKLLKTPCKEVADLPTIHDTTTKLWDTVIENINECIGLAANQIGILLRIFVMIDSKNNKLTFVNPRIIKSSGFTTSTERCMSIPNISKEIKRRSCVTVSYLNENMTPITKSFTGRDAICIQHEMDHLIGKLIIDS